MGRQHMDPIDDEIRPLLDGPGDRRLQGHAHRTELGEKPGDHGVLRALPAPLDPGQAPPGIEAGITQGGGHMGHQVTADDLTHQVGGLGADDVE